MKRSALVVLAALLLAAPHVSAQGRRPKREFVVEKGRAISVTREVLIHQGFEVVRIETVGHDEVVYYRRGNMGRGKGKGPVVKMIVRRIENRIVFIDTPDAVLVDINLRLRL